MKKYVNAILFLNFITKISLAQDYHYTQFDANPAYLNPALIGERMTDYKGLQFNVNFREQASSYTKKVGSFRSIATSIEVPVNSKFTAGSLINNNGARNGSLNTFNFLLTAAYKIINSNNENLSFGLQMGFLNKSIRPEKFTYDSQYSPTSSDGFDITIPSGESYNRFSHTTFDLNYGVYYRKTFKNNKLSLLGGFSLYHIIQPNESFSGNYSKTPLRINIHAGCKYIVNEEITILPQLLYMNQALANELNIGMLFFYKIENTAYEPIIGLNLRNKNAVIFQLGLNYKGTSFRMNYDLIINYLKNYKTKGFEFSIVQTLHKKTSIKPSSSF
jgi:type IX secretion system PorP/SprF family membrane protein